jgi:hypothetical protein
MLLVDEEVPECCVIKASSTQLDQLSPERYVLSRVVFVRKTSSFGIEGTYEKCL